MKHQQVFTVASKAFWVTLRSPVISLGQFVFQLSFNSKRAAHGRLHKHWHEFLQLQQAQALEKSAPEWQELPRPSGSEGSTELLKWEVMFTNHCATIWVQFVLWFVRQAKGFGESELLNIIIITSMYPLSHPLQYLSQGLGRKERSARTETGRKVGVIPQKDLLKLFCL